MNAVLYKKFILTIVTYVIWSIDTITMYSEFKHSHIGVLFLIRICQIFLMSRHEKIIQKQRFCKIVRLIEFFLSLTINNCLLSVLKRCPF